MNRRRYLSAALLLGLLGLSACADDPPPPRALSYDEWKAQHAPTVAAAPAQFMRVPLTSKGSDTHYIPVGISSVCCFPFMLDSGATDVSISPDIFRAMVDDGIITRQDMIGVVKYQTAAGTFVEGLRFRIPVLTVAGLTVRNVVGSVTPGSNMLLLGQSFLRRFKFWAIDNRTNELVLG